MLAEGRWNNFIERVPNAYHGSGKVTPTPIPPSANGTGIAYIEGNDVNLCKGLDTGYGFFRQLDKVDSYEV